MEDLEEVLSTSCRGSLPEKVRIRINFLVQHSWKKHQAYKRRSDFSVDFGLIMSSLNKSAKELQEIARKGMINHSASRVMAIKKIIQEMFDISSVSFHIAVIKPIKIIVVWPYKSCNTNCFVDNH